MDALVALQYRYVLTVLACALFAGGVVALLLSRHRGAVQPPPSDESASATGLLGWLMMFLVTLAVGAGVVLLLPAGMILRYFPHWRVDAMLIVAALILLAPLAYAWRARPS